MCSDSLNNCCSLWVAQKSYFSGCSTFSNLGLKIQEFPFKRPLMTTNTNCFLSCSRFIFSCFLSFCFQNTMNLPPDKVKILSQYDNEKKWDLICDQVTLLAIFSPTLPTLSTLSSSTIPANTHTHTHTHTGKLINIVHHRSNHRDVNNKWNHDGRVTHDTCAHHTVARSASPHIQNTHNTLWFLSSVSGLLTKQFVEWKQTDKLHCVTAAP